MNLIIFGPQASGKGTQAERIAKQLNIVHVSTGDIFRDNIARGTKLGKIASVINKGDYISDDITNKMIQERLEKEDCKKGFILDGYPRTSVQAKFLDKLPIEINKVINLVVSKHEVLNRISTRRVCENCKENYNLITNPPTKKGICNKCGGKLVTRKDDTPKFIKKRLAQHHKLTEPIFEYYRNKGLFVDVDGEKPIDEVFANIIKILE